MVIRSLFVWLFVHFIFFVHSSVHSLAEANTLICYSISGWLCNSVEPVPPPATTEPAQICETTAHTSSRRPGTDTEPTDTAEVSGSYRSGQVRRGPGKFFAPLESMESISKLRYFCQYCSTF